MYLDNNIGNKNNFQIVDNNNKDYVNKSTILYSKEFLNSNFLINQNWKININTTLKKAIMRLDKRSREIIYKRYLSSNNRRYTLYNLSIILKISKERVRQIEKLSIIKLKDILKYV